MNQIIITNARITKSPELMASKSGTAYLRVSVAVDRRRDKDNESVTDFIPIAVLGKSAENFAKYVDSKTPVNIIGELQSSYGTDKEGNKRTYYQVLVTSWEFSKGSSQKKTDNTTASNNASSANNPFEAFAEDNPFASEASEEENPFM